MFSYLLHSETFLWLIFGVALLLISHLVSSWLSSIASARVDRKVENLSISHRAPPIPVTLITGFLGSGKTTLLSSLLRAPRGQRLAVIENEAGGVAVDAALLRGSSFSGPLLLLANGCVCCSASGGGGIELEETLDRLAALAEKEEEEEVGEVVNLKSRRQPKTKSVGISKTSGFSRIDAVAVELSGLADPAPLARALAAIGARRGHFTLAHIVTLVDASAPVVPSDFADARLASAQLAGADIVVINKIDSLPQSSIQAAEDAARIAAPLAIIETARSLHKVTGIPPLSATLAILGLSYADPKQRIMHLTARLAALGGGTAHTPPAHTPRGDPNAPIVINLNISKAVKINAKALEKWASDIVNGNLCGSGGELLRMKGLVCVAPPPTTKNAAAVPQKALLQGVRSTLTIEYLTESEGDRGSDRGGGKGGKRSAASPSRSHSTTHPTSDNGDDESGLGVVLIGRHLNGEAIRSSWEKNVLGSVL
jgi:G3E family GTPase